VVGGREELLALVWGLADEYDERETCPVCVGRVARPPAQEGVVAAELVEVLVDSARAVVLDEDRSYVAVVAGELEQGVGSQRSGARVIEVFD
jgi:hypothetical protein